TQQQLAACSARQDDRAASAPRSGATGRSCRGKQATFRRTHRDEAQQRTGVSRVQRDVTPRSSITCHLALAEQERKVLDDNTHEVSRVIMDPGNRGVWWQRPRETRSVQRPPASICAAFRQLLELSHVFSSTAFHGDDGSTFTLSWVGDGTGGKLEAVGAVVAFTMGILHYPGVNGHQCSYRLQVQPLTGDYGKTFHDISSVMNNRFVKQEFGIVTGPGNSHQVILTVDVPVSEENGGVIFSSVDAGMSFKEVQLPFHPSQPISFHFSNASYLVAIGTDSAMWLSTDFGNSWRKVHEVDADRRGELLLRRSQDLGETFTTIAQRIFSFGYIGGFLFTSVMEKLFYSVLDGDEDMIFMHVDDPGDTNFGTIYTSDDRGVVYSKSLERHLFGAEGKSDFTNITSLRGVYLTNVLEKDGRIRTVISFDRGGEWRLLNKPNNTECGHNIKKCNLHIHGEYSHAKGLAPVLPLSDPSAVGLIIAHGSLGDSITSVPPDVYVSSDGGYTWTRTLRGSHHYAILDSGGLLVAVEARGDRLVSVVKFSTDEGQCWKIYNFTEQPIFLAGLASEPGTKTLNISIWGYRTEENFKTTWVTVTIDFEHLLTRECEDEDYEEWLAHSDMGLDSETRGCILGYRETFKRLKKLSVCRNGRNYVVAREESPCLCTREDYLCIGCLTNSDYGYYRHENSSECVEQLDFRDQALDVCLNGEENEIETVIVLAVVCVAAVTVLITAMLLIAKKMLCTRRIPEYRFSALQLQEDDECITVGPLPVVNGNGQSYHGDSDSDE
ncbi:sortilin-like, partial [Scleropages formosus]